MVAIVGVIVAVSSCMVVNKEEVVEAIAPQILATIVGDRTGIADPQIIKLGHVAIYVDQSASMRPYLSAGPTGEYHRFLEGLYNRIGADRATLHSFGFHSGQQEQAVRVAPIDALLRASNYVLLNNDYASLFAQFASIDTTRLVVTDGVQSDPGSGARFAEIIKGARGWIQRGGVFATLVYRSDYQGTYFPEAATCPMSAVHFSCPDRPFVVFAFAPSVQVIEQLLSDVMGPNLAPEHAVVIGGRSLELKLVNRADAPEGQRRKDRLLRSSNPVYVRDIRPSEWVTVDARPARANDGFMPLQFDIVLTEDTAAWKQMDQVNLERFITRLRPSLRAWGIDSLRHGQPVLQEVDVFQKVDGTKIEWRDNEGGNPAVARVTVPVRRPPTHARYIAWVLTLTTVDNVDLLVPSGYSTEIDCANDTCNRTLNLAPLLGAIVRDLYVPGRQMFVTDWRK
jgi:hypothetical protein